MQENGEIVLIVSTLLILIIVISLIILFTVFQRKKNFLVIKQKEEQERFEKEIAETQIEIREETLRNISWELHDNIGQLLTLAKIQLQSATEQNIAEVRDTITKGLTEVRALSKLINPEALDNINLKEAIQLEVDRFNRLDFIKATLEIVGEEKEINQKATVILFRILQEFFSNTIKHARASDLVIRLNYSDTDLHILTKDNGVGFKSSTKKEGIGLLNIKARAKLIGAEANLTSKENKGTNLEIRYNYE
ncbi:sensor histidine kinase [Polaribacter sp. P097]|uniref:sensor histidine kinase n=1 Tax=Polaribacter sp. P097 TaxID=3117398 RepID=UPI002FDFED7C